MTFPKMSPDVSYQVFMTGILMTPVWVIFMLLGFAFWPVLAVISILLKLVFIVFGKV